MSALPSNLPLLVAAIAWPLVAGLVLVAWSKVRAAEHARREAVLDAELEDMFRMVEGRPVPERLALVVEALEEAESMGMARAAAPAKRRTPMPVA